MGALGAASAKYQLVPRLEVQGKADDEASTTDMSLPSKRKLHGATQDVAVP